MPIYRPKSVNNILAALTVTTILTLIGATITGSQIPTDDATYDVGSTTARWKDLYASGTGTFNTALKVAATNTDALSIQDGNGDNVLTVDTSNDRMSVAGDVYSAGLKWTARTSSTDNEWRSITYGNGLFVAVSKTGSGNQIMTSPDGINWTTRSTPTAREWRYITYGNGMFVAVAATGTGNRVMTSPDGINWTLRSTPADYFWRAVAWGGGQFVATANTGTGLQVMTSPDGINWTLRSTPASGQWANVRYGNGTWVTVSADGLSTTNQVMTSTDGINWTAHDSSVVCDFFGLEYGKGLFIASGTDCLMTSPDGVTWTTRTVPSGSSHQWHAIKYGDGLFVSVSKTGNERAMYSYDGITWTAVSTPNSNAYHDVTFGNGMFVASANSGTGNRIMTSGNMRSYDVNTDGVIRRPVTISATGTATLSVQNGYGIPVLNADTQNDLITFSSSRRVPNGFVFRVQNDNNSISYLTVSATQTAIQGASNVTSLLIGKSTDNGNSITMMGDNAYISSQSGKALVLSAPGTNILYFSVGGANRLIADSSGNVVVGGHTAATARFTVSQNNATTNLFEINNANSLGVYSRKYFYINTTSTNVIGALVVNGNVRTSNTNFVMSSTQTSVVLLPGAAAERTVQLPSCTATEVGRTVFIKNTKPAADGFSVTVDVLNGSGDRIDDVLFGTGGVTLNEMDASNAQTSGAVFRCESSGRWYAF